MTSAHIANEIIPYFAKKYDMKLITKVTSRADGDTLGILMVPEGCSNPYECPSLLLTEQDLIDHHFIDKIDAWLEALTQ